MAKKQTTIQDIAKTLSITASTVSRALNDHPKIKKSTKDTVWAKAKELNYQPNTIASSLRKGKAKTVGMIVPRINRHFFSNIITGVESVLNPAGYNLIICQSEEKYDKEINNINTLIANRVSGLLISISLETKNFDHIRRAISNNIAVVMYDRITEELNVSKVENDDISGSYDLTKHLIDEGYKDMMWIGGSRNFNTYRNRFEGYEKALKEIGIDANKYPIFEGSISLEAAYEYFKEYLENNKLPEVVFSASDYMAMGAIMAIQEKGFKIPDDVAISGYSNEPFAALINPKLTTVEQFSKEMGRSTARILLDEMESNKDENIPIKTILRPKLIVRESTINKKKL
ncbi:MAG: LacI family DNA-binding transcriptional regulator [Prolixibacteraceae bacterium]|jgi:LacI family transcriptional regulator|nr:LacI family DNA-binding transcriptional regulator [Prolixibacteraceae bacterium]